MVRQWQQFFYGGRYVATPIKSPDYVKLAEAHGLKGLRVTQRDQVKAAVAEAQSSPDTCIVDFRVEQEDSVYPMVPAGADLDNMIRRPKPAAEEHNPIFEIGKDK
jgi:acetolactate synthase-1/2/3 large subunit